MRRINKITITFILFFSFLSASEHREVPDLKGTWKFYVNDGRAYANLFYDDGHWDKNHVPDSWEEEGYSGYGHRYIISGLLEILSVQEYQLRKENNNHNFCDPMRLIFKH